MIKSVEKALRILSIVAARGQAGPSEASALMGIHKSTAVRLMQTLESLGFLVQDKGSGVYRLGPAVVELARGFLVSREDLITAASYEAHSLREVTGETVSVYVRQGDRRVCVYRLESPHALRRSVSVGEAFPLHMGASGKVLLAYLSEAEIEEILTRAPIEPEARQRLQEELRRVRENGFAISWEEREAGIAAVAAPIMDGKGIPLAALSVSGPTHRLTRSTLESFVGPLCASARAISIRIVP